MVSKVHQNCSMSKKSFRDGAVSDRACIVILHNRGIASYSGFRELYTPSHTFISHGKIGVTARFAGTNDLMIQSPLVISRLVEKKRK